MRRFVLASASPRRAELLKAAGFAFDVSVPEVDERMTAGEAPDAYVRRMAESKALAVAARMPDAVILGADTTVVVGDDVLGKPVDAGDARRMLRMLSGRRHDVTTGVTLIAAGAARGKRLPHPSGDMTSSTDSRTLGQPERAHAASSPNRGTEIAGETNTSAIAGGAGDGWERAVLGDADAVVTRTETTTVEFCHLSDAEIDWYVSSGEPMDKAGAYAIQGLASRYVSRINGSYSNVVGIPVAVVYELLRTLDGLNGLNPCA